MKNLFFGLNYEKKNSHLIDKLQQPSPLSQHQRCFVLVVFVVKLTFYLLVCLFVFFQLAKPWITKVPNKT